MKIIRKLVLFLTACFITAALFAGCADKNNHKENSTIESNLNNDKIPSADDNSSSAENFEQTAAKKITVREKSSENNILLGDWECKSIISDGINMTAAQYAQMLGTDFSVSLTFDNDGYLTYTAVSGENTNQYNTVFDASNEVIATIDNDFLKYNKSEDILSLVKNKSSKMIFERL